MRDLTPDMVIAMTGEEVNPALLAEFEFDSGTLYMWSGYGTLTYNGNDYLGGGNLIAISPVEETQEPEAKGLVFGLSGVPSNLVATALTERTRGRPCRLYIASVSTRRYIATEGGDTVLTEDGGGVLLENQLVDSPYRLFTGMMDILRLTDTGTTSNIRLSAESSMIIGQRNKVKRYTTEEQKKLYPLDKGLDLIPPLQDKEVVW